MDKAPSLFLNGIRESMDWRFRPKSATDSDSKRPPVPEQIRQWRQKLLDDLPGFFSDRRQKKAQDVEGHGNFPL